MWHKSSYVLELQPERGLFEYLLETFKKLVSVLATSLSLTETGKEDDVALQRISCVHYLIRFKKKEVHALINSGSEVNAMTPAYASSLGLWVYRTNIGAQKINGSTLETFGIVLASFQIEDKLEKARFFQKTFLLVNINAKVVLGIPFLIFSNADVQFVEKELT